MQGLFHFEVDKLYLTTLLGYLWDSFEYFKKKKKVPRISQDCLRLSQTLKNVTKTTMALRTIIFTNILTISLKVSEILGHFLDKFSQFLRVFEISSVNASRSNGFISGRIAKQVTTTLPIVCWSISTS